MYRELSHLLLYSDLGEEEILVLRSTADEGEIKKILQAGATATVGSYDAALALNGLAESQGMVCDVHIKVDTGMGRYGFLPTDKAAFKGGVPEIKKYLASL